MDQLNQERRGMFGGLRVPFDLNMLVLGFIAVVGFWALITLTEAVTGDAHVLARVALRFFRPDDYLRSSEGPLKIITWLLVGTIFLGYWSFFSTAISRIAAMKLAREETLELKEAARFASRKFVPVLSSVLFVATILLVFYVICNATIAGFLMRVPGLDILISLLFFTVLLSTFFIVFSLVLGLFGMNLAASAIATESSDTWDGISRAWNYILVRPWHVILVYGLTFAYLGIFAFFGGTFLDWSVDSLALGNWGAGEHATIVSKDRADLPQHLQAPVPESVKTADYLIPGRVEFFRGYIFSGPYTHSRYSWGEVTYNPSPEDTKYLATLSAEQRKDIQNLNGGMNIAAVVPGTWKLSAAIIWFWLSIAKFVIAAYAVQYFFAATTTLYFLLRKEVEDEDYSEIVVEEEELEEEAAWEVKEPAKAGPTAPAGGLIMPTSGMPGAGNSNLKPLPMMGNTTSPAPAPAATSTHTPPASSPENKS
ncbi:MAG TPA: hypothetical protein VHF22_03440 [Planctomycetota bacterium]|nr:hypothetical protein [Planctomycetota bacterium]